MSEYTYHATRIWLSWTVSRIGPAHRPSRTGPCLVGAVLSQHLCRRAVRRPILPDSRLLGDATSPYSLFVLCNSGLRNCTTRLSPSAMIRRSFTSSSRPSKTTLCGRGTDPNVIFDLSSITTRGASHGIHNSA